MEERRVNRANVHRCDEQIERLLALSWWDWPPELIKMHINLFQKRNLDESLDDLEKIAPAKKSDYLEL